MQKAILYLLALIVLGTGSNRVLADNKKNNAVTLTGQLVCSECWFEEKDRKANPYGDEEDLKCAVRCEKTKVPQALIVWNDDQFTLYILEKGRFKKGWIEHVGKQVEIIGAVQKKGDKTYLKVDDLKPLPSEGQGEAPTKKA